MQGVGAGAGVMFETGRQTRHHGHPAGRRLDAADGGEPDALQPAAQPVQHDDLHHLQGNRQREMDGRGRAAAAGHGLHRDLLRRPDLAVACRMRTGGAEF